MDTNKRYIYLTVLLLAFLSSCSITKKQERGYVEPADFHEKLSFTTRKSVIIVPVEIDGESQNYLFDTGAQLTLIQRDTLLGRKSKVSGASKRKMKLGNEVLDQIKIGGLSFYNTVALNGDLKGLKEQIPDFGGIIGQPIISKANWLFNIPDSLMEISSKDLVDDSFQAIEIKREGGSPYTFVEVEGKRYKAVIDMGSSASFNIPKDHKLAKKMLTTYDFTEQEREIYSLGGLQLVKEKVGYIPSIKLGDLEFDDVYTDIRNSSQLRIGMKFFKECAIYIDNLEGDYKIRQIR